MLINPVYDCELTSLHCITMGAKSSRHLCVRSAVDERSENVVSSVEFSRWLKLWPDNKNANTLWKRENKVLECKMSDAPEGQHGTAQH